MKLNYQKPETEMIRMENEESLMVSGSASGTNTIHSQTEPVSMPGFFSGSAIRNRNTGGND